MKPTAISGSGGPIGESRRLATPRRLGVYERIYTIVRMIPKGKVATYGQIARIVGECTPRMVGYAMAALDHGSDVPWQRVINSRGTVSPRSSGPGDIIQQKVLESEGIEFDKHGRVDLQAFGWNEPDAGNDRA